MSEGSGDAVLVPADAFVVDRGFVQAPYSRSEMPNIDNAIPELIPTGKRIDRLKSPTLIEIIIPASSG